MQPQGPYGQNGQPPYPQGPPQGPNPYAQPGQSVQPGQPAPGPMRPQLPGQPPMPAYQVPQGRNQPGPTDNLPAAPDAATTPYDFFLQPKPQQASMPLPISGKRINNIPSAGGPGVNGKGAQDKNKFIFLAGGAIVVVLLLLVGSAFIPKDQTGPQLVSLVQTQQEVIRVCTLGSKAKYQSTRDFAQNCLTGVTTNQNELLAYVKKQNYEFNAKLIGAKANAQTTAKLTDSQSSSTFDSTFRQIAKDQITAYDHKLQSQLATTTGVTAREILSRGQRSAELLVLMASDESNKIEAIDSTAADSTGTATNP